MKVLEIHFKIVTNNMKNINNINNLNQSLKSHIKNLKDLEHNKLHLFKF